MRCKQKGGVEDTWKKKRYCNKKKEQMANSGFPPKHQVKHQSKRRKRLMEVSLRMKMDTGHILWQNCNWVIKSAEKDSQRKNLRQVINIETNRQPRRHPKKEQEGLHSKNVMKKRKKIGANPARESTRRGKRSDTNGAITRRNFKPKINNHIKKTNPRKQ